MKKTRFFNRYLLLFTTIAVLLAGCGNANMQASTERTQSRNSTEIKYDLNDNKFYVKDGNDSVLAGPFDWIEADTSNGAKGVHRYFENGLYGYIKVESGDVRKITEAEFIQATPMHEYSALVKRNEAEGWFYINTDGESFLNTFYQDANPFERQFSFARVDKEGDGLYELIDSDGNILLNDCDKISEIDIRGFDSMNDYFSAIKNGKPFIWKDASGNIEVIKEFDFDDIDSVENGGWAIVRKDGKYGVVDINGDIIVPVNYRQIDSDWMQLTDDRDDYVFLAESESGVTDVYRRNSKDSTIALYVIGNDTGSRIEYIGSEAWLVIKSGKRIGPYRYISDYVGSHNLVQLISEQGYYGFIDVISGEEIIPAEYTYASSMQVTAVVRLKSGAYCYIRPDGTISEAYAVAEPMNGYFGRVQCNADDNWSIIYEDDFSVVDSGYDMLNSLPDVTDLGTGVKDGRAVIFGIGLGDENGYVYNIIKELPYSEIDQMYGNDFALVTGENGAGIVSYDGTVIMNPQYDEISVKDKVYDESDGEQWIFIGKKFDGTNELKVWKLR